VKIIFLCSGLEPGRDGVGDYIRRLAAALIRLGHPAAAIAINDKHISEKVDDFQVSENVSLPILRIPAKCAAKERFGLAKKYIDSFNPEWLSLQYIMFHELWIGMAKESSVKQQYWGMAQKFIIKRLIRKLNPAVIHTQCELYQVQLKLIGFQADRLTLFGNIPNIGKPLTGDMASLDGDLISMVLFGTIHPDAPVDQFASEVAQYTQCEHINLKLCIIGSTQNEQNRWINAFEKVGLPAEAIGEQPSEVISAILNQATIGISTTAYAMTDKSGTVAAMREHGLPVICVSHPYHPKHIENLSLPLGVSEFKKGNFEECFNNRKIFRSDSSPNKIAKKLLESLIIQPSVITK